MKIDIDEVNVLHLPEQNRFEIRVNDLVAEMTYSLHSGTITFLHTGVPPELEGQGVGKKLVKEGLDYARDHGFKIKSTCWFVSMYLNRHSEYQTPK